MSCIRKKLKLKFDGGLISLEDAQIQDTFSVDDIVNSIALMTIYLQVAVPLVTFMVLAFIVLMVCRYRTTSAKKITSEIRKEIKNTVDDVKDFVGVGTRPRFRKRDKIMFYGTKMLRKVRANIQIKQGPSRQLARRIARKFLGRADRDNPQLTVIEPPAEYLQEDLLPLDSSVPTEFLIMLKNLRVFGYFDMPLFLELCKSLQTIRLLKGQTLFQVGEKDENIYIVQTGRVKVCIADDGHVHDLKEVSSGEAIISLLSFCDVLTGHPQPYKTVSAKAVEDSVIMKFPVKAFEEIFQTRQYMIVRVVQIVMVRLMRVTFLALHQYLGLSSELMSRVPRRQNSCQMSPTKGKRESNGSLTEDMMDEMSSRVVESLVDSIERESKSQRRLVVVDPRDDEESVLQLATQKFKDLLHLDSDEILQGAVTVKDVEAGTFLMKQDSLEDNALVYILSGCLVVSQEPSDDQGEIQLFNAQPGDLVGGLSVLSADPSFFSVRAKLSSRVATISRETFLAIIQDTPQVVLHVANSVIIRMSPFVRQIDFALDWVHLEAGRALYKQGELSDSTYIVLNGRLRSVIMHGNGRREVVSEYGKGDLVGIVELLTKNERSTTVMAIRDSELAKLPEGLFNLIKMKHPIVMTRLIKLLGQRILGSWKSPTRHPLGLQLNTHQPTQGKYSTVAIVPVSEDVPVSAFSLELHHSLLSIDAAARLTSDQVVRSLGTSIWESGNEYHLISWLSQIEDKNRVTLYQCDPSLTIWTKRCIRQADVILTVGLAANEPSVGKIEKYVEAMAIRTQKILVLLHREGGPPPSRTVQWLNMRSWCHSHHHIQAHKRVFAKRTNAKIVEYYTEKVFRQQANIHSDFARLARLLTGTSIGLVLGGGGARGAAHIGMIKAFQEAGIPIDMVGGVSIGAFFGALFCLEKDLTRVTQKAREWSMKMSSKWRMVMDLTYPVVSMFSGAGFNTLIREALGEVAIEDLWLPYFTLTTDITDSCARIHTHGCAWRYVRASMSLSGYMPPVCDQHDGHLLLDGGYVNNLPGIAWEYVRASMTLAMLLPPFPDPADNHLLMDGCYINNVPADVMHNRWNIGNIIAIDVGSQYDSHFTNYGDHLSGWNLLLRTTAPFKYFFRSDFKVPSLYDIQTRLSYVSCMRQLETLKGSDYCEYIRPPIDSFHTLNFKAFDLIRDIGYQHGKTYLSGMVRSGRTIEDIYRLRSNQIHHSEGFDSWTSTFTDLASVVCGQEIQQTDDEYSDESTHSGYVSEPATGSNYLRENCGELFIRHRTGSLSDNELMQINHDSDTNEEEIVTSAEV